MISELQNLLVERLQNLGIQDVVPTINSTTDPTHGDYASNVAFLLSKKLSKSPMEAASMLANEIQQDMPPSLSKVEVAKPGFINLTLSNAFLTEQLESRLKGVKLSPMTSLSGKKIMIEFTDPNPFKEFHIGHLYSNIVGESLSRLLESQGAEVRRVNYQGDVGLHVAKVLWGMQQLASEIPNDEASLTNRAKFLGQAYALGAIRFEEDEGLKQEIIELNKKIYEQDPSIMELYRKGRQWSLEYFETIYARLGTKFAHYYFESQAGSVGLELVKEYLQKGVFKESEGAVIFPGEKYGLHNRVFINSLGLPTYEAKELGLAPTKYKDYPYDLSIIVTGNEIDEYFRVLLKALSLVYPELAEKTQHLSHGMVRLPDGKMSSRTGNVVTGEWLLDEANKRAKEKIKEVTPLRQGFEGQEGSRVLQDEQENVAEMVGTGAVKYALLRSSIGRDIEFSFDESISFEGNAGPYLQYTYVRTQSVLGKWQIANGPAGAGSSVSRDKWKNENHKQLAISHKLAHEEREILRLLVQFEDIVNQAAQKYAPNALCAYLFDLAQSFNLFYQRHQIIKEEEDTKVFRLSLTAAVGQTIKDGLNLLGIKAPERM